MVSVTSASRYHRVIKVDPRRTSMEFRGIGRGSSDSIWGCHKGYYGVISIAINFGSFESDGKALEMDLPNPVGKIPYVCFLCIILFSNI